MPSATAPGSLPIGFRQLGSAWQRDVRDLIRFAVAEGFASVDPTVQLTPVDARAIVDAGLRIGTVEVVGGWNELLAADPGVRRAAAERTAAQVASLGVPIAGVFVVPMAGDPALPRSESFAAALDGLGRLCEGLRPVGARLAIEGWPGMDPWYSTIGCTPADVRALLAGLPANAGINFDPSHLVRMGIDPHRFVAEFGARIVHVHGKDTELLADGLYEHGHTQPATFAAPRGYGGWHWRYCIPGDGAADWPRLLRELSEVGYRGAVSIELEDERYGGSESAERAGLLAARNALAGRATASARAAAG